MAIFDFWSKQFYLLLIFKLLWYFLPSFKATDLFVQEKQFKNDFKMAAMAVWIYDWNYFNIFYLQVTLIILLIKFRLWWPSWISDRIGSISAIFDQQVSPILPTKFPVNWPFGSGEEVQNRFSRWRPWRPSWISDRDNFSQFCVSWTFGLEEKVQNRCF